MEKDISRFKDAYRDNYDIAMAEIRDGYKKTHWMWYIFPQLKGLGKSKQSQYYGIEDINEAQDFLSDSYLGIRIRNLCGELLRINNKEAYEIFGQTDATKLRSSMTLFAIASNEEEVFLSVLEKYFEGEQDPLTLQMLGR